MYSQGSHVLTKCSTWSVEVPVLTPVPIQRQATPVTTIVLMDASALQVQQIDTHNYAHTHIHNIYFSRVILWLLLGMVLDDLNGKGCVPLSKCSCSYNSKIFGPGESYSNNCKKWYDMYDTVCQLKNHSVIWTMSLTTARLVIFVLDCVHNVLWLLKPSLLLK